nr:MAG TPA: hypothetical protein [Caudoviricetes sp.]
MLVHDPPPFRKCKTVWRFFVENPQDVFLLKNVLTHFLLIIQECEIDMWHDRTAHEVVVCSRPCSIMSILILVGN